MNSVKRRKSGFTLLELIVVITIIGILGTVVVIKVAGFTPAAKRTKIEYDCKQIYNAATMISQMSGNFPESIQDMVNPKDEEGNTIPGGLQEYPKDPYGFEYLYEIRDGDAFVQCLGKDNTEGGEGEDADYSYPKLESSF